MAAYDDPNEFSNALGLFLMVWFMITVMFIRMHGMNQTSGRHSIPIIRRNTAFAILLTSLALAFLMLAITELTGSPQ
ncbi:hypothetical protein H0H92_013715 [Tricholoma furcatifolium]|nr:hypothetical protein H0H92_013715 [Tricholoma furcatifolium]